MNLPATPRLLAIFLTGILYPLCFPNLDFGWLAWFVLIPLHLAIDNQSPKQSFWWGWFAGTLGFTGTVSWVITAMHSYGKVPLAISILLLVLLAGYLGLYVGLYTFGVTWFRQTDSIGFCLFAPIPMGLSRISPNLFIQRIPMGTLGLFPISVASHYSGF